MDVSVKPMMTRQPSHAEERVSTQGWVIHRNRNRRTSLFAA